ncbi:MAG: DUF3150 domain-containing protein [Bryobacteraceae bacterium]|nr:DUF3150 domain-containing protein [Bryobacteraceae bacterium]
MTTQAILFPVPEAAHPLSSAPPIAAANNGDGGGRPVGIPITEPGVDLASKTVCIKVRLSTMGNTRKVSTSQIEADADKDLLRVSKHLLDSPELKAIGRFDGEIRRFLYNICLPFEIGIHLLPIPALEMVEQRLRGFRSDREALVQIFLAAYPGLCQDAARRLRGLYNPADYPPIEDVAREFGFSWQYVSFGVPDQLKGISREVFEQEREKAARRMAEASSEIQQVLRETMARLVQHMAERLKDGTDGKPLRFKESTVSNLVEFLANFQFRNVTDDADLQRLVGQARGLLQGINADDLRSTSTLRARVQQGMAEIAGHLDTMLVKAGGRKFRFDEEAQ